jgi:hypothetical protein
LAATLALSVAAAGPTLAAQQISPDGDIKAKLRRQAEHANKEPFGHIPKGPLQIVISIDQQELHLYSDGVHVADTLVATGVADHPTPLGIFSVIQKSLYHRSNIYSGAPMPYMHRITWSGVAIHEGVNLGHPASHGCIRMAHDFATQLWAVSKLGASVVIARPELRPAEIADPHLFVHQTTPAAPAQAAAFAKPLQTAETADRGRTTDAPDQAAKDPAAASPVAVIADRSANPAPTAAFEAAPTPAAKPAETARPASKLPIAIFISRKDKRIYVRQDFAPLFEAPITIEHPQQLIGTHIFTALGYLNDKSTLRWNVISLPGERPSAARQSEHEKKAERYAATNRPSERIAQPPAHPPPPETPQQALARVEILQDVIDRISQLIVPSSSLIISDQGLGEETGEGTGFIVVTR